MSMETKLPSDNVELYLPSVLGYEKIARRAAEAAAEQMEMAPARIEDIKTAVAEACMNAIEHGNSLERGVNVTVVITIAADRLEVRVADIGLEKIPEELPPPGSGDMRGWGMFFIRNLVDEVEITRLPEGGNQVRMTIHLNPTETTEEATTDAAAGADSDDGESSDGGDSAPQASLAQEAAAAVQSVSEESAGQSAEDKPVAVQPVEDKPVAVQPVEDKPTAVQPAEDKPVAVQSVEDKPTAVQPVEDKPAAVQAVEDKPGAVQQVTEKPGAEQDADTTDKPEPPQES